MSEIRIDHHPDAATLERLGVFDWPIWSKEASEFPWQYAGEETCYFLEGDVTVTPEGGRPVRMGKGDLVIFPDGMACSWAIHADVRKHYDIR